MKLKVYCALLTVVALPFVLDATTGCSFRHGGTPDPTPVDPNSYVCACNCSPAQRHRDVRISLSDDDIEQRLDNTILLNSIDLDFLNGRYVGLRFENLKIPQGVIVLGAQIQFTVAPGSTLGALTVEIRGEAADNAPDFSITPGSLGTLFGTAATTAVMNWSPPNWLNVGEANANERTPDLSAIVQEIVNRPGWVSGNSLAFLIKGIAGAALRKAFSFDGQPSAAALLSVDYIETAPTMVGPQNVSVCMPSTDTDITSDCSGRVQTTLSDLDQACGYPSDCSCSAVTAPDSSERYSGTCDQPCTEMQLNPDCSNFDPKHNNVTATNVAGDQPVCAANSALSAEVFGRRTSCTVSGNTQITVSGGGDSDTENSATSGVVQFVGDPCPPDQSCPVGMEYRLDFNNVSVGNFFESATFKNLAGLGENASGGEATVSGGSATFQPHNVGASAQGRRDNDPLKGVVTDNEAPVGITVGWGQTPPTCSVNGALIGNVDPELKECNGGPDDGKVCQSDSDCTPDSSCDNNVCSCVAVGTAGLTMNLDVGGDITNQPPTANAGPDQNIECTSAAVNDVTLDASASSDPDSNIALYSWLRGSRAGKEVGFDEVSKVEQPLGSQTYVLRVIDALGQADEDTTVVNVIDTMPPVLSCVVGRPVLNQTNHDLINVGLMADAQDQCEGTLPVTVNVFGDEDDDENTGDGKFSPDAKDIAVGTLRLRAERKGNGDGRVYLIITEATDSSGNRGFNCCTVSVPLSNTLAALTSVQHQAAAAKAFCLANDGTAPAGYFVIGDGPIIGPKQ